MWKQTKFNNYEVSKDGKVRNKKTKTILSHSKDKDGYHLVAIGNKTVRVARLILETFCPIKDNTKPSVKYKDGNKSNLNLSNLQWSSDLNHSIQGEKWKKIILGTEETWYSISDHGRVRNDSTGTILKGKDNPSGYRYAHLKYRVDKYVSIHRMVAKHFLPHPEADFLEVNHIDGNKANNKLSNLEWSTKAENIQHAVANGLIKSRYKEVIFIYSPLGEYIKESTVEEFASEVNLQNKKLIYPYIDNKISGLCYGFQLRKEKVDFVEPWFKKKTNKKCSLYTVDGEYIKSYVSQLEAAKDLGYSPSYISQVINQGRIIKDNLVLVK